MIIVNPGTEPCDDATESDAMSNIEALIRDAGIQAATFTRAPPKDSDGRFAFIVALDGKWCEVEMPGLPLDHVRYMRTNGQNIWRFPRLYVDGSSWVWCFAVDMVREALGVA